jgi:hypothetical protein
MDSETAHDCDVPLTISSHFQAEMKPPAGIGPTGASTEVMMRDHRNLLPWRLVILRIVVKITISRR